MSNDAPPRLPSVETNSFSLSESTDQSTYWQYFDKCLRKVYDWHQRGIKLPWNIACKANTMEVSLSEFIKWGISPEGDLLSGEETSHDAEVLFDFIRSSKLKKKLRNIQFNGRTSCPKISISLPDEHGSLETASAIPENFMVGETS